MANRPSDKGKRTRGRRVVVQVPDYWFRALTYDLYSKESRFTAFTAVWNIIALLFNPDILSIPIGKSDADRSLCCLPRSGRNGHPAQVMTMKIASGPAVVRRAAHDVTSLETCSGSLPEQDFRVSLHRGSGTASRRGSDRDVHPPRYRSCQVRRRAGHVRARHRSATRRKPCVQDTS